VRPWYSAALLTLFLPAAAFGQSNPGAFFLVARPGMPDPNFRETVVLAAQDERALVTGVILNRPTGRSLAELLPSERFKAFTEAIYFGGPVARQGLFAVFRAEKTPGEAMETLPGLYLALLPGTIDALINRPPAKLRFFAGYSGWGPGQLDREIERGDWLVVDADAAAVFLKDTSMLWQDMLRRGRSIRTDAADRAAPGRIADLGRRPERRVYPAAALCAAPDLSFSNCMAPLRYSTRMTSFAANSPSSIRFASGFSMVCWMARLSGRAP
jgi:putative transcriptional regulator